MKSEKTINNTDFSEYEKVINYRSELYVNEYIIFLSIVLFALLTLDQYPI